MPKPMTQAERLTRIETLLEEMMRERREDRDAQSSAWNEMREDIKAIRKDADEDKADLAALKNRGAGILIGVGLACGALGASLAEFFGSIFK